MFHVSKTGKFATAAVILSAVSVEAITAANPVEVQEKFERNFRLSREMRHEILVYESILTKF